MDRAYPFPELVAPEEFEVLETHRVPQVDMDKKLVEVPLFDTPLARCARAHELGHVKWSPREWDAGGLDVEIIKIVEECRINNLLMDEAKVDLDALEYEEVPKKCKTWPDWLRLAALVATYDLPAMRGLYHNADKKLRELADEAYMRLFETDVPSFESTMKTTRWFQEILLGMGWRPAQPVTVHFARSQLHNSVRALPLKIHKPPLTRRITTKQEMASRKRFASPEGEFLWAPHRWAVDKHVFDRRKRIIRGTLLIDASGSMRLTYDTILALVERAPTGVIAMYSSDGHTHCNLVILANRGRYIDQRRKPQQDAANGGDINALRWLACQPMPRYWISDGGVTGDGDQPSLTNSLDCYQAVKRGRIRQVLSTSSMIKVLEGKATPLAKPRVVALTEDGEPKP